MRSLLLILALVLAFGPTATGQEEPPLPETWGRYWPDWGHEWMSVSVALNPDGSVSSRLPDNAREKFEYQMKKFRRLFGSAAEHGLDEGIVAPKKFCPPEGSIAWGDKVAENLGSVLLLSEVAVRATIESVALGFSPGGSPRALVRLSDVAPLTIRSPVPEYAVFPIGQLVARDHVFCGNKGQMGVERDDLAPYRPRVGSRILLIGGWRDGTVFLGSQNAWYAEVNDGVLQWWFGGYEGRTLKDVTNLISSLETKGLFEQARHLATAEEYSMERMRFGQAWARAVQRGCEPTVVSDGGETVECEIEP